MSGTVTHLGDGALVRILDGQPLPGDDAAHLAGCAVCEARLRTLEGRSAAFSGRLERARAAEPTPPPDLWERVVSRAAAARPAGPGATAAAADGAEGVVDLAAERARRRPWWRAPIAQAAILAGLLVAGAVAAEPVREWIGAAIERLTGPRTGVDTPVPERPAPEPVTGEAAVTVSFVPAGSRLEVRIDRPQPAGRLVIVFEGREDAAGEVVTDDPAASLLVLPDGFRARNPPDVDWSYRFRIPARVRTVVVRIGDRVVAELSPEVGRVELPVGAPR